MKPIILQVEKYTSFERLKQIVEEAYQAGYEDGQKSAPTITWPQPISVPTINPNYYTTETPWWETHKYEVTCNEAKT